MCLKEENKDLKNIKKIIAMLKSLNIIMNKIVFFNCDFNSYTHNNE